MEQAAADQRIYLCIDLKTFYASVECADRGRDTLTCNLVVADPDRGRTTICLAVSAAMKKLGVRNRCRMFDIPENIDYIVAKPRMRHYMEVSAKIYSIYLEFVSPDDIHVYSIDECFIDATPYLTLYHTTPRAFARELMDAVFTRCGIRATAGIGTNLFLAKVALDITAKHVDDGIGYLDEQRFREQIWRHRPITDIWGIGPGIAARLAKYGAQDLMGVAALDEDLLYREFGVTAEYLIDHARGVEPCTIAEIHAYKPEATSIASGQVLPRNYTYEEARTVLREMVDSSVLDLVDKHAVCDGISLYVGYASDRRDLARLGASGNARAAGYTSAPTADGSTVREQAEQRRATLKDEQIGAQRRRRDDARAVAPAESGYQATEVRQAQARGVQRRDADTGQPALFVGEHGTRAVRGKRIYGYTEASRKLGERTNSFKRLMARFDALYREIVDPARPIKRVNIGFAGLMPEEFATSDLFRDEAAEQAEHDLAEAVLAVRERYGKNSLLRGTSYKQGATGRERNEQVGGHHA